jgi:hypothetical protein
MNPSEQMAGSCRVLCCAKVRETTKPAVRPCYWQDRNNTFDNLTSLLAAENRKSTARKTHKEAMQLTQESRCGHSSPTKDEHI